MNKIELKKIVKIETSQIFERDFRIMPLWKIKIVCYLTRNNRYYRAEYLKSFRYFKYYENSKRLIQAFFWFRRYNHFSLLLNSCINSNSIGDGFFFVHSNIVINKKAVIGKNVCLLGDNCIRAGTFNAIAYERPDPWKQCLGRL